MYWLVRLKCLSSVNRIRPFWIALPDVQYWTARQRDSAPPRDFSCTSCDFPSINPFLKEGRWGGVCRNSPKERKMASDKILEITDSNFDSIVAKSDIPVLVDFWAPWCGPCRQIGPIIEQLAEQYTGKIKVGKVNVDENQEIASQQGISGIPAIILFSNGERVDELIGAAPKSAFEKMIDRHL